MAGGRDIYIKVLGQWKYLYRAVDKEGSPIDFLLRAKRDPDAATRFCEKAMCHNGETDKVTMDKSGSNKAAIDGINKDRDVPSGIRQIKYLNNIVEQDRRVIKRITKLMMGFKSFHAASNVLAGIELMYMIHKGQMVVTEAEELSFAEQFYALAG